MLHVDAYMQTQVYSSHTCSVNRFALALFLISYYSAAEISTLNEVILEALSFHYCNLNHNY